MSYNRVVLVGNLGKDAEVRFTSSGTAVANFAIATTERWTTKEGEKQKKTEWHRIVLWGRAAEALQSYLVKGKQVLVEGSIQSSKWQDKEGNDRYTTEIKARGVTLLGGRPDADASAGHQQPTAQDFSATDSLTEDDIPF